MKWDELGLTACSYEDEGDGTRRHCSEHHFPGWHLLIHLLFGR